MEIGDAPIRIVLPFAATASPPYIQYPIPDAPSDPGRANFQEGFPPLTFVDPGVGGIPPFGADFNGVMRQITDGVRWMQAGGPMPYNTGFAADIGGYPAGAIIPSATTLGLLWISSVDDNTGDPDAGAANWIPASIARGRIRLGANLNMYVSTSGNDGNDGLTPGTAFATIQRAASLIQSSYDVAGFGITVNIAPGTYAAGAVINGSIAGGTSTGSVIFRADSGAVIINGVGFAFAANQGAMFSLAGNDFTLTATLSGNLGSAIIASGGSKVELTGVVDFGACDVSHVVALSGGTVTFSANENIVGSAPIHFWAHASGLIDANGVFTTITGSPTFSLGYAFADECAIIEAQSYAWTGTSGGPEYQVLTNSVINTFGGGGGVFPGSLPPVIASGGQYV